MRKTLIVAAALSLAACGGKSDDAKNDSGNATAETANSTATTSTAAAPSAGAAPTKDFMVGKWAEEGDCATMAIDFKADGSMDGPADKWELKGNELTFVGMPQKMVLSVVDDKTMESRLDGTEAPRKLVRC